MREALQRGRGPREAGKDDTLTDTRGHAPPHAPPHSPRPRRPGPRSEAPPAPAAGPSPAGLAASTPPTVPWSGWQEEKEPAGRTGPASPPGPAAGPDAPQQRGGTCVRAAGSGRRAGAGGRGRPRAGATELSGPGRAERSRVSARVPSAALSPPSPASLGSGRRLPGVERRRGRRWSAVAEPGKTRCVVVKAGAGGPGEGGGGPVRRRNPPDSRVFVLQPPAAYRTRQA